MIYTDGARLTADQLDELETFCNSIGVTGFEERCKDAIVSPTKATWIKRAKHLGAIPVSHDRLNEIAQATMILEAVDGRA